jgi:hypothetical protein
MRIKKLLVLGALLTAPILTVASDPLKKITEGQINMINETPSYCEATYYTAPH